MCAAMMMTVQFDSELRYADEGFPRQEGGAMQGVGQGGGGQ